MSNFMFATRARQTQNNKNKSNSTAGAAQVEANLQEQLSDHFYFRKPKCC